MEAVLRSIQAGPPAVSDPCRGTDEDLRSAAAVQPSLAEYAPTEAARFDQYPAHLLLRLALRAEGGQSQIAEAGPRSVPRPVGGEEDRDELRELQPVVRELRELQIVLRRDREVNYVR